MSNLQKEAALLIRWQNNPEEFFRFCWPDIFLYPELIAILRALVVNRRVAVRSGHGLGKTWLEARICIWFLTCFKPSKVITTAPTFKQVEKVLWTEIANAYHTSRVPLGGRLLTTEWKVSDTCYAIGIATKEGVGNREFGATSLQGFHSPNLLFLLDEAAGVAKEIFTGATSLLTGENNKMLCIGNPASPTGPFFDAFKSEIWHRMHISCLDHPNVKEGRVIVPGAVTREWIAERKAEWGENSPLYRAKVLGEFPDEGADTLIPLSWIERAVNKADVSDEGTVGTGSDIARYGEDETATFGRKGGVYTFLGKLAKAKTTESTGFILNTSKDFGAEVMAIDDSGVGGGVTDELEEQEEQHGMTVQPVNFGESAIDKERFANMKAEIFWGLRTDFENGNISIPDDMVLINQLASIKYGYTSKGQVKIESKDDMKKRGLKSPDRADALAITWKAGRDVVAKPGMFFV